jgi:hypothetical protein
MHTVYVPNWKTENATARITLRARNKISPILLICVYTRENYANNKIL